MPAVACALLQFPASALAFFDPDRAKLATSFNHLVGAAAGVRHASSIQERSLRGYKVLVVGRDATVPQLAAAAPASVRRVRRGVWEVRRPVVVINHAKLTVSSRHVRELRLLSTTRVWASIVARNASLTFSGSKARRLVVRSWDPRPQGADHVLRDLRSLDPRRQGADHVLRDGRASVSLRGYGRMDASHATFEDLGFYEGRDSGFAFTQSAGGRRPTGRVLRSRFVRNVFGAYSYQAVGIRWVGNDFVSNQVYGLDPHDNSDHFLVQDNYAARNGRHGIIFSRFCDYNIIRGNRSVNNGWHGIVLDDGKHADGPSNHNVVEGNTLHANHKVGISVDGSSDNVVRGNTIDADLFGVRIYGPSDANIVRRNLISTSAVFAVFVDGPATGTIVRANRILKTPTGVDVRDAPNTRIAGNRIVAVTSHGVKVRARDARALAGTRVLDNVIGGRGPSPVLAEGLPGGAVPQRGNRTHWDFPVAHDVARVLAWWIGPGVWLILLIVAVGGSLVSRGVDRLVPHRS